MKERKAARLGTGRKLGYAASTVVLLFALLEGGLRIFGFEYETVPKYLAFHQDKYMFVEGARTFERDDYLFWRLVPNQEKLGVNPQGFRGPPFQRARRPGVKRILCMGCSVTFGLFEPRAYAAYLEEILNRDGDAAVEVYNLGVPGYSSFQGLRLFESTGLDYEPDLVTILFGWNDHWLAKSLSDKEQRPHSTLAKVLDRSRLYQFLFYLFMEFRVRNRADEIRPEDFRVSVQDYLMNLRRFVTIAKDRGIEIVLVTAPTAVQDPGQAPGYLFQDGLLARGMDLKALHEQYNHVVRVISDFKKVPLADCAKALEPEAKELMMSDGIHPNEDGHRRIAEEIARTLREAYPDFSNAGRNTSNEREEK